MAKVKAVVLLALLVCCAVQAVVGKEDQRRWRERGSEGGREVSPEEEERWAAAEERRRQEEIEKQETHRGRRPSQEPEEEEEETRGRRHRGGRGGGEEEEEDERSGRRHHGGRGGSGHEEEEDEHSGRRHHGGRGGGGEEEEEDEHSGRSHHHGGRGGGGDEEEEDDRRGRSRHGGRGGGGDEEEEDEHSGRSHHGGDEEEEEEEGSGRSWKEKKGKDLFLLGEGKRVLRSEAGEMRLVRGYGYGGARRADGPERPLHIGFITMEPRSLFVPQYLDSSLILFLQRGEAKIGLIYKDALVERRLRTGDIYRVPAGSAFYLVNTAEGQRLRVITSIDPAEGLGLGSFQSFFIGGGKNPMSVLAGFEPSTLSTAFNVSIGELKDLMTSQEAGPFVYTDSHVPSFDSMKREERLGMLKRVMPVGEDDDEDEEEKESGWSWRKLVNTIMGANKRRKGDREGEVGSGPDPFNLYEADPSFRNNYGSSLAVDKHVYEPLKKSHLSVYYVNLTAGTMMAPHVNPTATEYGVVLRGSGTIQIVYPNGSTALNAKVREGSVFWVPRYFPFCQMASRSGPLEFFGFTTSARRNHPQFLVGVSSVFRSMWGPEFAAAFGLTEDRLRQIFDAQREAVALPSPGASPGDAGQEAEEEKPSEMVKKMKRGMKMVGREMVMGFE